MTRIFSSFLIVGLFWAAALSCTAQRQTEYGIAKILTTTGDRSQELVESTAGLLPAASYDRASIVISPSQRYQTVYGFGAALTGSTCYNLMQMTPENRRAFLTQTFSPSQGLGSSYVRISIGCSDFSLSEYTLCDKEGIENFALTDEEKNYIIPILKEVLTINPQLKIIGSPWTAPRWMKVNSLSDLTTHNQWTSGQLNPKFYSDYAEYFAKWIEAMRDNGITITALTIQNEPLNRGNSASMYMGWEEQRDFIKQALGKTLQQHNLATKVYLFDHNYNYDGIDSQKNYPTRILEDAEAAKYVAGSAFHNYGGSADEITRVKNAFPDKEVIFTETSIGTWNDGRNLSRRLTEDMEELGLRTLQNGCSAVLVWNLMLDEKGAPNREGGCKTCFGAVDIASNGYTQITRNSHYFVIGHLSAVIKPEAVRIGVKYQNMPTVQCLAFENPDKSIGVVLINKEKESHTLTLQVGNSKTTQTIPANAVVSLLIR
jgi:glycoside hydrolase family 30, candidate beta-glycosidase